MIDVLLAKYRPHAEWIKAQISSILAQEEVTVNLIERDDARGDGPSANFSELLGMSQADYIAFSDQDDVWEPQKLSRLLAKMHELETEVGSKVPLLVFCDSVPVDDNLRPMCRSSLAWQGVDVHKGLGLPRLLMQNFIAGNTMLFNAALREKAGKIPEAALMHDCWMVLVAAAFGKIGFVPEPLVKYRQHSANALGTTRSGCSHYVRRGMEGHTAFLDRLARNVHQAAAFVERFGADSPECVRALAHLPESGWMERRRTLFRHGLWKQGIFRNVALLLCV